MYISGEISLFNFCRKRWLRSLCRYVPQFEPTAERTAYFAKFDEAAILMSTTYPRSMALSPKIVVKGQKRKAPHCAGLVARRSAE